MSMFVDNAKDFMGDQEAKLVLRKYAQEAAHLMFSLVVLPTIYSAIVKGDWKRDRIYER